MKFSKLWCLFGAVLLGMLLSPNVATANPLLIQDVCNPSIPLDVSQHTNQFGCPGYRSVFIAVGDGFTGDGPPGDNDWFDRIWVPKPDPNHFSFNFSYLFPTEYRPSSDNDP